MLLSWSPSRTAAFGQHLHVSKGLCPTPYSPNTGNQRVQNEEHHIGKKCSLSTFIYYSWYVKQLKETIVNQH